MVGRETDRKVAEFVFTTLRRTADELSDKEARAFRKRLRKEVGSTVGYDTNFRAGWLNGFIGRIAERYLEEKQAAEKAARSSGTSLVRLDKAREDVVKHMKSRGTRPAKRLRGKSSMNTEGHIRGRAAGDRVNIRGTGLGEGSKSSSRRIGGGV